MIELSVVVPAWQNGDELARCLASLVQQRQHSFEVIIVDDGSEPPLRGIVEGFRNDIQNLTYLWQPNGGQNRARNRGARSASGEFIAFLDSDDDVTGQWADDFIDSFSDKVGLVSCAAEGRRETGRRFVIPPRDMGQAYDHAVASFQPGAYAIHRDLFWHAGGFDLDCRYGEHHELGIRLAKTAAVTGLEFVTNPHVNVVRLIDRSEEKIAGYDTVKADVADHMLRVHPDLHESDAGLVANLLSISGVASFRLGMYGRAASLFVRAFRSEISLRGFARIVLSIIRPIGHHVWGRNPSVTETRRRRQPRRE